MKIFKLFATIILLNNVASAGFLDTLTAAANAVAKAGSGNTLTNIQYIGVSDEIWVKQNNLTKEEADALKELKTPWLEQAIDNGISYEGESAYFTSTVKLRSCSGLATNKIAVLDSQYGGTAYFIELPESMMPSIIAMSTPLDDRGKGFILTTDGYFICPSNRATAVKFIYYSASTADEVCKASGGHWRTDKNSDSFPWYKGNLVKIARYKEKETESAQFLNSLEDKLDLGPFKLGMSKKDLPAGGTAMPASLQERYPLSPEGYSYLKETITYGKTAYAGLDAAKVELTFEEDILTSIHFEFNAGQDVSVLGSAIFKRFGNSSDNSTGSDGILSTWKSKSNRLTLYEFNSEITGSFLITPADLKKNFVPSIALTTTRFEERIKALGDERKEKGQNAHKAKAAKMAEQL
jgi:hypothetical protein